MEFVTSKLLPFLERMESHKPLILLWASQQTNLLGDMGQALDRHNTGGKLQTSKQWASTGFFLHDMNAAKNG